MPSTATPRIRSRLVMRADSVTGPGSFDKLRMSGLSLLDGLSLPDGLSLMGAVISFVAFGFAGIAWGAGLGVGGGRGYLGAAGVVAGQFYESPAGYGLSVAASGGGYRALPVGYAQDFAVEFGLPLAGG